MCLAPFAQAQVITCPGAATGSTYASCKSTVVSNAPGWSTPVLWCESAGNLTAGAPESACGGGAWWYPWNNMQTYSWVLTSYAGWQRQSNITFTGASQPTPPSTSGSAGQAALTWEAVINNTDGTAANIASYQIQYGQTDFSQTVSTTATSYTFNSLAGGSWQFRVVAIGTDGSQSAASNPVQLTIAGTQSWKTAASESVYEAVLPQSGTQLVQGNVEGTIPAGKACGNQVFTLNSNSYRTISDSDASYNSPTYLGRNNVAVCTLQ
jgi:hypothetical protein